MNLYYTTSIIAAIIAALSASDALADPDSDGPHARELQLSAQYNGYDEARKRWDRLDGQCSSIQDFQKSNEDDDFPGRYCKNAYYLNSSFIQSCKDGAETFVREKQNECSNVSQCNLPLKDFYFDLEWNMSKFCGTEGDGIPGIQPRERALIEEAMLLHLNDDAACDARGDRCGHDEEFLAFDVEDFVPANVWGPAVLEVDD